MKYFDRSSFTTFFLIVFSVTLFILGSIQALFNTLRWYNASEQKYENFQDYPIYSASDEIKPKNAIRVFIAPKPTKTESNVYVFIQDTTTRRKEAMATIESDKAQQIQQKIDDVTQERVVSEPSVPEIFQTPVQISVKPLKSTLPRLYSPTIDTVLSGTYFRDVLWDFPLVIDNDRVSPRGQMSNHSITLSGRMKSSPEIAKVLVHELAHMVDIYLLKQRGRSPDPSKEFYAISWSEPTVLLPGMTAKSFASGYAATNQFEDFAEAFTLYVFHNSSFVERAKSNPTLQQKYDFLRNRVLGEYFLGTNFEQNPLPESLWDVTKIALKTNALRDVFVALKWIV
jgi:hypothetical protein